jgi:5-methylcytosine-specific restriction endonuclease McrA
MDRILDSPKDRIREENIQPFDPKPKVKKFIDPKQVKDPKKLNGWKWYYTRREYLMYHPYCARCGNLGEEVHHIYPRHSHPHLIYKWNNLETLCKECHRKEHNHQQQE